MSDIALSWSGCLMKGLLFVDKRASKEKRQYCPLQKQNIDIIGKFKSDKSKEMVGFL